MVFSWRIIPFGSVWPWHVDRFHRESLMTGERLDIPWRPAPSSGGVRGLWIQGVAKTDGFSQIAQDSRTAGHCGCQIESLITRLARTRPSTAISLVLGWRLHHVTGNTSSVLLKQNQGSGLGNSRWSIRLWKRVSKFGSNLPRIGFISRRWDSSPDAVDVIWQSPGRVRRSVSDREGSAS